MEKNDIHIFNPHFYPMFPEEDALNWDDGGKNRKIQITVSLQV